MPEGKWPCYASYIDAFGVFVECQRTRESRTYHSIHEVRLVNGSLFQWDDDRPYMSREEAISVALARSTSLRGAL